MQGSQELITMASRHCSTSTWVAQCTAEEMRNKNRDDTSPVNKISARNLELATYWRLPKLHELSIQCRNGCVGRQMSKELMTMAATLCSNVQQGGWHFALQKKRAEKTWLDHSVCVVCRGRSLDTKGPLMHYHDLECYEKQPMQLPP